MTKIDNQEIEEFIASLATRCDAYSRNKTIDLNTGQEVVIPVSENRRFHDQLQRTIDQLCAFYLAVSDAERTHIRELVEPHHPILYRLLDHIYWAGEQKPHDWLLRALAAASIENNKIDFRDIVRCPWKTVP